MYRANSGVYGFWDTEAGLKKIASWAVMNFSHSADLDCVFIISLLRVEQKVINSELLI